MSIVVTYTFVALTIARSAEVNQNFTDVLNALKGAHHQDVDGTLLVNADIDPAAAIAYSKLNLADSIVNADINSAAAIAWSKISKTGSTLDDLDDVTITTVAQGDVIYRNASGQWVNLPIGTTGYFLKSNGTTILWDAVSVSLLDDIGDVTITGVGAGEMIYRNSGNTAWVNLTAPAADQVLGYNSGVPGWKNQSYIAHNSLSGHQGGSSGQYYHLTSAEYTNYATLTGGASSVADSLHTHELPKNSGLATGTIVGNSASGTYNVAHGLSKTPRLVRITANTVLDSNKYHGISHGVWDSGGGNCIYEMLNSNTNDNKVGASSGNIFYFERITSSGNYISATLSVDGTNLIFTVTLTGTGANGGSAINILWEAEY